MFLILLIKYSFLSVLLYFSLNLLTLGKCILVKDDLKTLNNLLFLFFNFKETACVKISLFKCILFRLTKLNSTFLLYIFFTKRISSHMKGFSNLLLFTNSKYLNLLYLFV